MSDNETPEAQPDDQQARSTLNLRQDRAETHYANLAMLTSTPEEVVMHFGLNISPPTQERQVNAEITTRVVMSYASAKRLALTLGNVIQRYESQRGVIDVGRAAAPAPAAAADDE